LPEVLAEVFDPASNVQVAIVNNLWYEGETGKLKSLAAGKCACIFVDPATGNAYWRTFNATSANQEVTAWASDVLIAGNYDAAGTAAAAVTAHASAADPHAGYQKESEKGQASGYAGLDGSALVPLAQLGMAQTLAADGYVKLPGGLILQWKAVSFASTSYASSAYHTQAFTWPLAFPTAHLASFAALKGDQANSAVVSGNISTPTVSGGSVVMVTSSTATMGPSFTVFGVGY
jgi:hypothetical protein